MSFRESGDSGDVRNSALGGTPSAATSQVERDVVTIRKALDYPKLGYGYAYREALDALDRLARKAHEADALIAQHELCGGAE